MPTAIPKTDEVVNELTGQAKQAGEQLISSLRDGGALAFDTAQAWVDLIGRSVPKLGAIPFAPPRKELQDIVSASVALAQEVLTFQRDLAFSVFDRVAPAAKA